MRTYIYTKQESPRRGYDVQIRVYRLKRNEPIYLGCGDFQYGGWRGAYSGAVRVASQYSDEKLNPDGYGFKSDDARMIGL